LELRLANCQQFLVETANLARSIYKMYFKNPVALASVRIQCPHAILVLRVDVKRNFISRDLLMREDTN